jgi:hypothetical protein
MDIHKYILILLISLIGFYTSAFAFPRVNEHNDRIFIVDRHGEEWDVTEAMDLGFKPKEFQYGIGRNAFTPLDDSELTDNDFFMSSTQRIIGIKKDDKAHAYSVKKLSRHEVANTVIADTPISAAY